MKKLIKLTALVMALSVMVLTFNACGGTKLSEKGTITDGVIVFGTNAEFEPFEFVDAGGVIKSVDGKTTFDGIDMVIANKIGSGMGYEAQINNIEFDSLIVSLNNGQIDAVIAGMTVTAEREEEVDFSTHYYNAAQVMIVKEDNSDVKTAADMKDKKIAVVQGYTGETAVQDLGFEYTAFKKGTEAILDLVNGKVDVVVIDSATAGKYIQENEGLKIVEDNEQFPNEEYAIAVKKGNTVLLAEINAVIDKMIADGKIAEIADSYI